MGVYELIVNSQPSQNKKRKAKEENIKEKKLMCNRSRKML